MAPEYQECVARFETYYSSLVSTKSDRVCKEKQAKIAGSRCGKLMRDICEAEAAVIAATLVEPPIYQELNTYAGIIYINYM